jgi:hypothetical protein
MQNVILFMTKVILRQGARKVKHLFGEVSEIFKMKNFSIARITMSDDIEHYHKKTH